MLSPRSPHFIILLLPQLNLLGRCLGFIGISPLAFRMKFDRFTKPPRKPPPKITPPRTQQDQLAFRLSFAEAFSQLTGHPTHLLGFEPIPNATEAYTDGSCPNQYQVCVGNPAGWGFTIHQPPNWIDAWGPVAQNLATPIPGSNNTAELQALLEALDFVARHKNQYHITSLNLHTDSQLAGFFTWSFNS